MKPVSFFCVFLCTVLMVCCVPEDTQIDEKESFYLKGVINQTDKIEIYTDSRHSGYGYAPNHNLDYIEEGPRCDFPFGEHVGQEFAIRFLFKIDKSNLQDDDLPVYSSREELLGALQTGEWDFYYDFSKDINDKAVGINLYQYNDGWNQYSNTKFEDSQYTDLYNNNFSKFELISVQEYEDSESRSGVLVSGEFNCVLYDSEDSLILDNMNFQGFIKFPRRSE